MRYTTRGQVAGSFQLADGTRLVVEPGGAVEVADQHTYDAERVGLVRLEDEALDQRVARAELRIEELQRRVEEIEGRLTRAAEPTQ